MKRLSKALAAAGVASRRAAEQLIFDGKVAVNGKVVLVPQTLVDWAQDDITVNGDAIKQEQEKVYFVLNKPKGYVCSSKPIGTKKLVIDLFKEFPYRLFTVGRLDRDTTGLLLVTNDGHFAQKVIHPSKGLTKEYLIKTEQEVVHDHLEKISRGTKIEGVFVKPVKVTKMRRGTLKIIVREGKKREVRLLVQNAGLSIVSLERIRIGSLMLGHLPVGEFRPLTEKERKLLTQ
jgi:23S rRNA pseudouridine2605 synthase